MPERPSVVGSPRTVALFYAVLGSFWILFATVLSTQSWVDSSVAVSLPSLAGFTLVVVSAAFVYGLLRIERQRRAGTTEKLDRVRKQSDVLHRILRHNLRNSCTVIRGHTTLLAEDASTKTASHVEPIDRHTNRLIELSRKSERFREVLLGDIPKYERLDVARALSRRVEAMEARYPEAEIESSLPDEAWIETHPRIETVFDELLENAIVHDDDPPPTAYVSLEVNQNGSVSVEIRDEGPGLPAVERAVLENGAETPTVHSEGIGLWMVRAIVEDAGGDLSIEDAEPRGTIVTVTLPRKSDDAVGA